jgi:hypothetical protein
MGDATSEHGHGRHGRPRSPGSSVLTPPTGTPTFPELRVPGRAPQAPPPAARTVVDPCACGHAKEAHEHYRRGSDCGVCGAAACDEYSKQGGPARRALRRWLTG